MAGSPRKTEQISVGYREGDVALHNLLRIGQDHLDPGPTLYSAYSAQSGLSR